MGCLAPLFYVEFRAQSANNFRSAAFRGKHSAQEKQIASFNRFHIGAERLRWRGELNAKFFQTFLSAGEPRAITGCCMQLRIGIHYLLRYQYREEGGSKGTILLAITGRWLLRDRES